MRRWIPIRTALALGLAIAGCAGSAQAEDFVLQPPGAEAIARDANDLADPTTIVALVAEPEAADRLEAAALAAGYGLVRRDLLDGLGLQMLVLRLRPGVNGPEAIAELEAMEPGTTAGVNHAYRPEPSASASRGRTYADALLGWPAGGCAAQAPVGVIDTDVAADALGGARVVTARFVPAGGETVHGTAVAGLLAGPGRLTGASLYHAAVVGPVEGRAPAAGVDSMVLAIDWLQSQGVRLVNVSLAGPYNKILDRGLQAAARRGMVIVAAAGNTGPEGAPRYPAAFGQTIAVTAVDAALAPYAKAPKGAHLDVAAPGVDVLVRVDGTDRYLSGTSIAAPFVTAVIAADPRASTLGSAPELRDWIAETAKDIGPDGPDPLFGVGLIQAGAGCNGS